ncbi:MAG TPA: FixH family protein, partial [Chryseolinea sp.]
GKSIVLAFVLFAIFIGVLVTVCVRQDISLVTREYYKEDLDYQSQMDRERNAEQLIEKPKIDIVDNQSLRVAFDFSQFDAGKVVLYSPSDISEDKTFELEATNSPFQIFSLGSLKKGNYRIKMTWSASGKEFYFEKSIFI